MDADERLVNLLGACALALADRLQAATERALGEQGASAAALVTIAQYPGGSIEELRRALGRTHSATVRVVDRLVARGWVRREAGARGPAVALVATPTGVEQAQAVLCARWRELRAAVGDRVPRDLAAALEQILARITPDTAAGDRICRLCHAGACPQARCPVARRQRELGVAPAEPVHLCVVTIGS